MSSEEIPEDFNYTEENTWVKLEDGKVRIGITDSAQDDLGDVEFVELPGEGESVDKGEELASVESIKATSDISSPVSGTVSQINGELEDQPDLINVDPYGDGWICVVESSDPEKDLADLMDAESYEKFLESQ